MTRSSPRARQRRRAWFRHLSVWVGLLCLLGQVSSSLHMLLVRHVRCAEHGELVHAEEHQNGAHAAVHAAGVPGGPSLRASEGDGDHGHDHCLVWSDRRKLALLPAAIPAPRVPIEGEAPFSLRPVASVHRLRLYAYAPKTSPPA